MEFSSRLLSLAEKLPSLMADLSSSMNSFLVSADSVLRNSQDFYKFRLLSEAAKKMHA